jgi:DNA-directed RNA polymerase subunit RPC12/RpoP
MKHQNLPNHRVPSSLTDDLQKPDFKLTHYPESIAKSASVQVAGLVYRRTDIVQEGFWPPSVYGGALMDGVKVKCVACGGSCMAPEAARGKTLKCPHCMAKLLIPEMPPIPVVPPKAPRPETVWVRVEVEDEPPEPLRLVDKLRARWKTLAGAALAVAILAVAGVYAATRPATPTGITIAPGQAAVIVVPAEAQAAAPVAPEPAPIEQPVPEPVQLPLPKPRKLSFEGQMIAVAVEAVRQSLKAPKSAVFPDQIKERDEFTVTRSTHGQRNFYRVRGWVEAQNTFGAQLRSRWVVGLITKDGEVKSISSVKLDE